MTTGKRTSDKVIECRWDDSPNAGKVGLAVKSVGSILIIMFFMALPLLLILHHFKKI